MPLTDRLQQIVELVDRRGFMSVKELSETLAVSEVTVRRDLKQLADESLVHRRYGGASSIRAPDGHGASAMARPAPAQGAIADRVDVLIATTVDPQYDRALLDRAAKRGVPMIAESVGIDAAATLVAVDNFQAGVTLGRWAGSYARQHFAGRARLLDLTYHLDNTLGRSQGFIAGLRQIVSTAEVILSIDAQSDFTATCQVTRDALDVHPGINLIFAINDTTARGAIEACKLQGLDPTSILVLTFGIEGDTLKDEIASGGYCKAGLAMFPEIVAPLCVEAAIEAYNHAPLPRQIVTPHLVLSTESLPHVYTRRAGGWEFDRRALETRLALPVTFEPGASGPHKPLPSRIGFVVPFIRHEWYINLIRTMREYAVQRGIALEVVDAAQNLRDEVTLRQRRIAQAAAGLVSRGEVLLIDGDPVTTYLAGELCDRENITVITNSIAVIERLRNCPNITLISTGGLLRPFSDNLTGPTAEAPLRGLRADKLFLSASGITTEFGLSHLHLAEVAIKQAMIRAARDVILLADHTRFGVESIVHVAPLQVVTQFVTDDGLPASTRLELTKLGIEITIAAT